VVKAEVCGTSIRGFKSRRSPFYIPKIFDNDIFIIVIAKYFRSMQLIATTYTEQRARLPKNGRQIVAQFDDEGVVVYQAYRPAIGHFAAKHGYFGGEFSLNRMSWIKPNFLWMMYRSGWGQKEGQEVVLAVKIQRSAFDRILADAVCSGYKPDLYPTEKDWKRALHHSDVRLQWDPDHSPRGGRLARRAIQLGLRGDTLATYAKDWIISIEDISGFVYEQHQNLADFSQLIVPSETIYPVPNAKVAMQLQLSGNSILLPEGNTNEIDSAVNFCQIQADYNREIT
jgi:Domain of unknown function (DUF4291)